MTNRNVTDMTLLSREEAAESLGVSLSTIDRYLRDGTLRRVKIGKRIVRIDAAQLSSLVQPEPAR
jgi:excisionase family DNA binding protein